MADPITQTKASMHAALEHLKQELKGIRAGRANPALVESVTFEAYGSQVKLKDVATISVPEPRQLLITPFDTQNVQPCAKAIEKTNLGITPRVEGKSIRITMPELNQARRKELTEQCHKKREECKIVIRNIRREQNEVIKKQKSAGTLPEDDFKRLEKEIQNLTDKSCKDADDISAVKEKEISTV